MRMVCRYIPLVMMIFIPCSENNSVNIAGGKPTFQNSECLGGVPTKAVDGIKDTNFFAGFCSHTCPTKNPWWAVDLQWRRLVGSVNITNRGDAKMGHYLSHIRIGTTDASPATTAPTPTNFRICASQDASVADGATVQFSCGGQGRYLVVLLEADQGILALCEVEVYASRTKMQFHESLDSRLLGYVFESMPVYSELECAGHCLMNTICSSFNLRVMTSGGMICELNEDVSEELITANLTPDPLCSFYQIQYQG